MNLKKAFIGMAIFWIILIAGIIAINEYTLKTGEEVLLNTRPVDPRDLFRGDYVILSYEISSLSADSYTNVGEFKPGDTVYVILDTSSEIANASSISKERPSEGIFMRGIAQRASETSLTIEYGIESYFVPEGEGKVIESAMRNPETTFEVVTLVDSRGRSKVSGFLINKTRVDI